MLCAIMVVGEYRVNSNQEKEQMCRQAPVLFSCKNLGGEHCEVITKTKGIR